MHLDVLPGLQVVASYSLSATVAIAVPLVLFYVPSILNCSYPIPVDWVTVTIVDTWLFLDIGFS